MFLSAAYATSRNTVIRHIYPSDQTQVPDLFNGDGKRGLIWCICSRIAPPERLQISHFAVLSNIMPSRMLLTHTKISSTILTCSMVPGPGLRHMAQSLLPASILHLTTCRKVHGITLMGYPLLSVRQQRKYFEYYPFNAATTTDLPLRL